jgi:uncharacterized membrane protein required for colicin V production
MIDLGCLLLLGLSAFLGWRRGLLLTLLSIVGVVLSYLAAYWLHAPLGRTLGPALGLQPILAYPVGGLCAFAGTSIVIGIVSWILRRRRRRAGGRGGLTRAGQVVGAVLGAAHGAALCLLLCWALLALQALSPTRAPDARGSVAGRITAPLWSRLAGRITASASGSPVLAGAAGRFAGDPLAATQNLSQVLTSDRVQSLLTDRRKLRQLARPGPLADGVLRDLADDRDLLQAAQRAGVLQVPPEGLSPEDARRQLADRLAPLARAAESLRRDPEVRRLLKDRTLVQRIKDRDLLSLANDPGFNQLAARVLEHLKRAREPGPKPPDQP